ncbi:MAG: hypothetical protein SGARI_001916 [Bacillariaceae sp.]
MTVGKLPLTPWKDYNISQNAVPSNNLDEVKVDVRHNKRKQASRNMKGKEAYAVLSTEEGKGTENIEHSSSATLRSCFQSRHSHRSKAVDRKIHFNEMAMVIWIECIDDLTDEELDDCYLAPHDYVGIREREKNFFRQLSSLGMIRSTSDDCLGLETRIQRYQRKGRSREAIYAVIFEQEMNRDSTTGVCNAFFLAQVYLPFTQISAQLARDRASRNAVQAASICDPNRFVDVVVNETPDCSTLKLQSDEQMEEVYQELKGAVDNVQHSVYKGMMKYAVACIPPSPATLRLGHGNYLEMSDREEEQLWSEQKSDTVANPAEYYTDGYEEDGEEKKSEAPSRQEMIRHSFDPPRFPMCGAEHYHLHMKAQHHHHMIMKQQAESRWMAQQQAHNRDVPQRYPPHDLTGVPGHPGWVWSPSLCDFVPVPTNRTGPWNV